MNNPYYIENPYSVDPTTYVQSALMPMTGQTSMPSMTPAGFNAPSYYGPTHAALSQAFQGALQQQLGVPGLLSQMQNNPALAQQIGGLLSSSYTPPVYPHYSIDWEKAAKDANATKTEATSNEGGGYAGPVQTWPGEGGAGSGNN